MLDKNQSKLLQRALREITGIPLDIDGKLGEGSLKALQRCCEMLGITPLPNAFEGEGFDLVMAYISLRFVSEEAFGEAAEKLQVDEPSVRAIAEVETKQSGFLPDGRLAILFERHWFYKKLKVALKSKQVQEHVAATLGVDASKNNDVKLFEMVCQKHPDICNVSPGGYKGGATEWDRLKTAAMYDAESAYASASYGSFQIMGFNYKACGYSSPMEMVKDFARSESAQFLGVCGFIKSNPAIHKALKAKDWAGFASGYNGPDYKKNNYDEKLSKAYSKWVSELKK